MGISSREAANARFTGTGTSYDAVPVDAYVARVVATLDAHERAIEEAEAEISRLEHALDVAHVVQTRAASQPELAGRVLGKAVVAAGAADVADVQQGAGVQQDMDAALADESHAAKTSWAVGLQAWLDMRYLEQEERDLLRYAEEEIRRLMGKSNALAAEAAVARHLNRRQFATAAKREADTAVTIHLEAAGDEAALVLERSLAEADRIVATANQTATERTRAAEDELADLNRRLSQVRTAIGQAGASLDALAESTRTEMTVVDDIIGLELHSVEDLDVRKAEQDQGANLPGEQAGSAGEQTDDRGFYERRLAGLRDRLEKS